MEYTLTYYHFKEALKEGRLLGLKCKVCGGYTTPPKKVCSQCSGQDLEIVELCGQGEILTFTVIRVSPEGFKAPCVLALVTMDEGPQLVGRIIDLDPEKASMNLIGKRVRVGGQIWEGDKFSGGEGIIITFSIEEG